MFSPPYDVLCDVTEQMHGNMNLFVLYNKETNYYSFFTLKVFNITRKPATLVNTKEPFDVISCPYKMKQSHGCYG